MEMLPAIIKRRKKMADDDTMTVPKTATVRRPRTPAEDEAFATAKADWKRLEEERDQAIADKENALKLVNDATAALRKLDAELQDVKSRGTIHQLERDEAVGHNLSLIDCLKDIAMVLARRGVVAPQVSPDAEAPNLYATDPGPNTVAVRPPTHEEMIARINGK